MARPNKDIDYLSTLRDYYARNGFVPSYGQIARLLGFKSRNAAMRLVRRLRNHGFVRKIGNRLAPTERFFSRPIAVEKISAGYPAAAGNAGEDIVNIDRILVRNPAHTVLVPVKGDSMTDAGILEGDTVVVERDIAAGKGDFVLAIVDNEFTLKELNYERGKPVLKPHNQAYSVIRATGGLEIFGVVVGQFRTYRQSKAAKW